MHPLNGVTRTVDLKNIIANPQIIVGNYTYYDDPEDVLNFEIFFCIFLTSSGIS
jgi:virginiamycin A acetyltransferase